MSWQAYFPGSSTVATLHPSDLYDCDKSKGINAIVLDESATWCGPCNQEGMDLEMQMESTWKAQGVAFVTLMVQDANMNEATTSTALDWKNQYTLNDVYVAADPNFAFRDPNGGLPTNVIIDPRTMKIQSVDYGYDMPDPRVSQLATKNK